MIEKASNTAIAGGSGVAMFFGLTPGEWQAVGVIGGLLIGLIGLAINAAFQWARYRKGL